MSYYGWSLFVGNTINTTNVWDAWMICRSGLADAWGTRTGAKGAATTTDTYSTNNPSGSGIATAMNGAMVTVTVTRSSDDIIVSADITPASENAFNITWAYSYGDGDDTTADIYLCFGVDNAYLNITDARTVAENYTTVSVMSEDYEQFTANADILSALENNGWSFNGRQGTNPTANCTQGTTTNLSKYANIQYPNIAGDRAQIWSFQNLTALTGDNWTITFSAALTTPNTNAGIGLAIIGTSSTYSGGTNSGCSNAFFKIYAKDAKSTTYTPVIGSTELETLTLTSGTWYKYTIKVTNIDANAMTATIYAKITTYDEQTTVLETTQNNVSTSSIGTLKGFIWLTPRANMPLLLDDVQLTKEISTLTCAAPTYTLTGASGTSRKFTLACESEGSTCYYSTTELAAGADGWTEYTGEVTTSAATIYAYAAKSTANSDVISFSTNAGENVQLATPTISRNAYNTVTITADQSSLGFGVAPEPAIYYTYGGEATLYTGAITVSADETIEAYAVLDGYTTSETASRAVALYPTVQVESAPENNTYSSVSLSGNTFTSEKATYDALILDGSQWGDNVYIQTTNFGYRNGGSSNHWYFNSTSSVWLCMKDMKAGDVIVCRTTYAASSLVNATYSEKYSYSNYFAYLVTADGDVEIGHAKPNSSTMHYFYGVYAYSNYVSATIGSAGYATFASSYPLDLSALPEGLEAYYITTSGVNDGYATLTQATSAIPADEGIILKGTAGTYSIPVATSGTALTGNKLVGVTGEAATLTASASSKQYVLVGNELQCVNGSIDAEVPVGKAYLDLTGVVAAKSRLALVFPDDANAIKSIAAESAENAAIYNLSGQRVNAAYKGIVIKNGKKYLVR